MKTRGKIEVETAVVEEDEAVVAEDEVHHEEATVAETETEGSTEETQTDHQNLLLVETNGVTPTAIVPIGVPVLVAAEARGDHRADQLDKATRPNERHGDHLSQIGADHLRKWEAGRRTTFGATRQTIDEAAAVEAEEAVEEVVVVVAVDATTETVEDVTIMAAAGAMTDEEEVADVAEEHREEAQLRMFKCLESLTHRLGQAGADPRRNSPNGEMRNHLLPKNHGDLQHRAPVPAGAEDLQREEIRGETVHQSEARRVHGDHPHHDAHRLDNHGVLPVETSRRQVSSGVAHQKKPQVKAAGGGHRKHRSRKRSLLAGEVPARLLPALSHQALGELRIVRSNCVYIARRN